jgi:hypothetical protein
MLTKYFSGIVLLIVVMLLSPILAAAQSTDAAHPTPIPSFPLVGRLAAGTYYYSVPVIAGPGTMGLQITAPDGGATISVSLSGPDCCTAEAYVSSSTGRAETIRNASEAFTIPSAQTLLITMNIAVAAGDTARFSLSAAIGGGSGVIVTPPPARKPATAPGGVCTDLGVDFYTVTGETGLRKEISGVVRNLTTTHPYKGYRRLQWLEVLDITDSEKAPRLVRQIMIPDIIDPGATFSYSAIHTLTERRRTRYKIQIVYSPYNATDRSQYNDDCNSSNNSTTRRMVGGLASDDAMEPVELLPRKP